LGSFSDNPTRYNEFLCFTWAYALTWGDTYNIISDALTEDEKERIWKAVKQQADQLHEQHPIDTPCLLRQYLRLSLNGAIKMGTWDQIPGII
jgi:hypothetical protein